MQLCDQSASRPPSSLCFSINQPVVWTEDQRDFHPLSQDVRHFFLFCFLFSPYFKGNASGPSGARRPFPQVDSDHERSRFA